MQDLCYNVVIVNPHKTDTIPLTTITIQQIGSNIYALNCHRGKRKFIYHDSYRMEILKKSKNVCVHPIFAHKNIGPTSYSPTCDRILGLN